MKILHITHWYLPEICAPSGSISERAQAWVKDGNEVTVLTGFPNHPTGVVPPSYRRKLWRGVMSEDMAGVRVVRGWIYAASNGSSKGRILNYASFFMSVTLIGLFLRRSDVVVATSPHLLAGLSAWIISRVKRIPFVLEVRDLWPESVVASGMVTPGSWFIRALDALAAFLYRQADRIVVVTPAFREDLRATRQVPDDKIRVIENGVNAEIFKPAAADDARAQYGLTGRFVVTYCGTIGYAHALDIMLDAAEALVERLPAAMLVLIGEGGQRQRLMAESARRGLRNVLFIDSQPRTAMPALINASDVCFVHLRRDPVFLTVIPSKMLEFMACARPIILGVDGQAREILDQAGAGVFCPPEDRDAFVRAIVALHDDEALREQLGRSGRQYVTSHFSSDTKASHYLQTLEAAAGFPETTKEVRSCA